MLEDKSETIELLRRSLAMRDDDISALRKERDALERQLFELKTKRLTLSERLRGRLLLPPPREGI